jgi:hypothetical protein
MEFEVSYSLDNEQQFWDGMFTGQLVAMSSLINEQNSTTLCRRIVRRNSCFKIP